MATPEDLSRWLADLDLSRIAISAEITADGTLKPVGGMPEKLSAAAESALRDGTLEVVILAQKQPFPEAYRKLRHLSVIETENMSDAIGRLYQQYGSRAAVCRHEQERSAQLDLPGRGTVPLRQLYQEMPLLREVPASELPDKRGPSTDGEPTGDAPGRGVGLMRLSDIHQWEEALTRREATVVERHDWRTVFQDFRRVAPKANSLVTRLALLGPPGGGKSTFVQFLAHEAANGVLQGDNGVPYLPARLRLRDWERWAVKRASFSIEAYLTTCHRKPRTDPAPTREQWAQWLQRGEVLLLLDGLDEIAANATFIEEGLKPVLTAVAYHRCPLVLTCRTVSRELLDRLGGEQVLPLFRLEGLEKTLRDRFIEAYPAQHFTTARLIEQLDQLPAMRALAGNPLLLSLICLAVDDPDGVPLPATREQLYDRTVTRLLGHYEEGRERVKVRYPSGAPSLEKKRKLLEEAALTLFSGNDRSLTFTWEEFENALEKALRRDGAGRFVPVGALAGDLLHNSGLVRRDGSRKAFFLHLTIQEYLAACALARVGNGKEGWKQRVAPVEGKPTLRHLINRKAWDFRWREVIALLAGRLREPRPLLALLSDERRDDYFRHRLALAAYCLPDIKEENRARHREWINRITAVAFAHCWEWATKTTEQVAEHLRQVFPHLAQVGGETQEHLNVNDTLGRRLQNENIKEQRQAIELLALVGEKSLPQHVDALLLMLQHKEGVVRLAAERALGALASLARPEHVDQLMLLLKHKKWEVRVAAVRALRALATLARPEHVDQLVPLLHDSEGYGYVQSEAEAALGALASLARPEHVDQLLSLLQHKEGSMWAAVEALHALVSLARPEHVDQLMLLLHNLKADVDWRAAAEALGTLASLARPEHVDQLIPLLQHRDRGVRLPAVDALVSLARVATAEHLDQIMPLLHGNDIYLPPTAAIVMQNLLSVGWRRIAKETSPELGQSAPRQIWIWEKVETLSSLHHC